MNISVFLSSSGALKPKFYDIAAEFGKTLAQKHHNLIYGGANVGMMKTLAENAAKNGAKIVGVIPDFFDDKGLTCNLLDEVYYVKSMSERKDLIIKLSDAFVALPGGFGTLDELLEVIVLKQIDQISAPIVILNSYGYYDKLLEQFDVIYSENFAKPQFRDIYFVTSDINEAFDYLGNYTPQTDKNWYKVDKKDFEQQ